MTIMHKVIEEFKVPVKDYFVFKLNERIPHGFYKSCRIDGKEYQLVYFHSFGLSPDNLLKHIAIRAPEGGSFVGKEVEFIFLSAKGNS